jgi:hypothetical protein
MALSAVHSAIYVISSRSYTTLLAFCDSSVRLLSLRVARYPPLYQYYIYDINMPCGFSLGPAVHKAIRYGDLVNPNICYTAVICA